ncbi:MAG: TetR family transcriptional regulator [Dyella sp.]|nr:TetR family transcriptional regulator [Dyella sp.]
MKLKQARAVIIDEHQPPAHGRARTNRGIDAGAEEDDGPTDTARRILEIAERLFAEQGVEQVALRQIVVESGQRNRSALHYHFGSREALVSHLLNRRLHQINRIRNDYLDALEQRAEAIDIHAVVEATILPLVDVVLHTDWGTNYLQVLAQTTFSPGLLNKGLVDRTAMSALYRVREHIFQLYPNVPREVMKLRMVWFMDTVVYSLAHWVRERGKRSRTEPPVDELIDFCSAALQGPPPRKPTKSAPKSAPKSASKSPSKSR